MFDSDGFRAQCEAKLAMFPPDANRYRAGFLSCSIPPPGEMPLPGSAVVKCANCPEPVVVGPQQQRAMRGEALLVDLARLGPYSVRPELPVLCLPCIGALSMIAPDIAIDIAGIGTE